MLTSWPVASDDIMYAYSSIQRMLYWVGVRIDTAPFMRGSYWSWHACRCDSNEALHA